MSKRLVLPEEITIRGKVWRVVQEEPLPPWHAHSDRDTMDGHNLWGLTQPRKKLIALNAELKGDHLEEIFFHELVHAMLPVRKMIVPAMAEERIAKSLEKPLAEIVRQLRYKEES